MDQSFGSDFKNFISIAVNDSEWVNIYHKVIDQCMDKLVYYTKVLKTLFKISDTQCDVRYQAFVTCFNVVTIKVSRSFVRNIFRGFYFKKIIF